MKSQLRIFLKPFIPAPVRTFLWNRRIDRFKHLVEGKESPEVFGAIYSENIWGGGSGSGSKQPEIVEPYVASIAQFAATFENPIDAVDLGCGDFLVGSAVRSFFNRYVAADVVPDVIAGNRDKYRGLNVEFRVINIAESDLPNGDVAFIRQVLQHLSNAEISAILERVCSTYPRLILTEQLPARPDFQPNIDKRTGYGVRLHLDSGIDIERKPFNVRPRNTRVLCDIFLPAGGPSNDQVASRIRTTLYEF